MIKCVHRVCKILNSFIENNNPMKLSELEKRLHINKSSLYRLVKALQYEGYLEQDNISKKYNLGEKILALGLTSIKALDVRKEAQFFMERLNKKFGETVNLGILAGDKVLYVEILKGKKYVHQSAAVGKYDDLYSTALGKVLLSGFDENKLNDYLSKVNLVSKTKNTITDKNVLLDEVRIVRSRGYAVDNEENEENQMCFAVPIKNIDGKIIAAISISFLAISVDIEKREEIKRELLNVKKELSARFGYIENK